MASRDRDSDFYVVGGTLPADGPSYVDRQADYALFDGLLRGDFCYVLDTRQVGKSSLIVRTAQRLVDSGIAVASLDLTAVGQSVSAEQWYYGLLVRLGQAIGLGDPLKAYWQGHRDLGPLQRWFGALREAVLRQPDIAAEQAPADGAARSGLVVFIDEIDAVAKLSFPTDEFFAAIRECYNRRPLDPVLRRLTFCLVGCATPETLIHDVRTTPFNVGTRVVPAGFTLQEASCLAPGLMSHNRDGERLIKRIHYWTSGQPYLTQRLCAAVAADESAGRPSDVDRICEEIFFTREARDDELNLGFVARRLLDAGPDRASILDMYCRVRARRHPVRDDPGNPLCAALRLSGVAREVGGRLWVSNRIYHRVFDRKWVREKMPGAEWRRQRAAFRRGALRTSALAAAVLAVVGGFAYSATLAAAHARYLERAAALDRDAARRAVYLSDVSLAQQVLEQDHDATRAESLLDRHRAEGAARFEWRYLRRECASWILSISANHSTYAAEFTPDGARLLTAGSPGDVEIWNSTGGSLERTIHAAFYDITSLAVSPDGAEFATAEGPRAPGRTGWTGTIRVWDIATGRRLAQFYDPGAWGPRLAWSPDGKYLACGGDDRVVRLRSTNDFRPVRTLQASGAVNSVGFSGTGDVLAAASDDGILRIWRVADGVPEREIRTGSRDVARIAISRDGRYLATAGHADPGARIWDAASGRLVHELNANATINALAFARDGRLALALADSAIELWNPESGGRIGTLFGHSSQVTSVAFSADGNRLASASFDGTAKVWDVDPREDIVPLQATAKQASNCDGFSTDGTRVSGVDVNATACSLWDAATGRRLLRVSAPNGEYWSAAAPLGDDRLVAVPLGDPNDLEIFPRNPGAPALVRLDVRNVRSVAVRPDGRWLAVATQRDGTSLLEQGGPAASVTGTWLADADRYEYPFSPDGRYLAYRADGGKTMVRGTEDGRAAWAAAGTVHTITALDVSRHDRTVVIGGSDGLITLFDMQSERQLLTLRADSPVLAIWLAPDQSRIRALLQTGVIRTWRADVPPG